jgi:hypothetical protein
MTIFEFLQDKELIAVETVNNLILNLELSDGSIYGLNVDTSEIAAGTPLTHRVDFTINDNLLILDDIEIDMNIIEVL